MRLWLNVLAFFALTLTMSAAADARGGMAGTHMMRPAFAATHGAAAKPVAAAGSIQARNFEQRFRPARQTFAAAGGGYGFAGSQDAYAGDYGSPDTAGAEDRPPPLLLYRYERPPQLTCFRPRLINLGHRPRHDAHLPKVVYGGPLPCGFKGT